ncbi:aminotransferase class V-fold PLP-dependent enzyme [Amnibacterium kyonggiense]|uniref:Selenocysteine lyase/cysteine desulfurase n=1 Tax=Amnibacterium kyonggiense TaxID=595671 RepID=A0A4R7FF89_9MICO|nr:aminotransferase class V-fold PLP-dependent enzyme [Amnibacterium kyonggiense]TDS76029.1 selenocysteine lyase/cysteine desulfurase [Amnibacterium kyonggiense]
MDALNDYLAGFGEDPGYLDFAAFGPLSAAVVAESAAQEDLVRRARHGARERLERNAGRLQDAAAVLTGFRSDQIVFQPSTAQGITQAVYGLAGGLLVSPADYPALPIAAARAAEAMQVVTPVWLEADGGRVTPSGVRDALTSTTMAVLVSAVDGRTGAVVDLDGIRQVIGDRLLIVDAVQALGAVDLPWGAADVIACGGQKWLRAGWGAAFLAVSDRAANRLTPVLSGHAGIGDDDGWDHVPPPVDGAPGMQISQPDQVAAARLAAGLEELAHAGPAAVAARIADRVARVIALADEFGLPVTSPRAEAERAGVVVVEPLPDRLTALTAALFNHGVSVTIRDGRVRLSPHAGTTEETIAMLRSALSAYATAVRPVR